MKNCSTCQRLKPLAEFSRNRSTHDGLQGCCKQCNAKWNADHKEEQRAYHAEYRRRNKRALARYARTTERKAQNRRRRTSPRGRIQNVLRETKHRARTLGIAFDLTVDDITIPTHCPVFGIPIAFDKAREYVPSIDRVDRTKGYTKDNIAIMSMRANRLKSDATLDELKRLVAFYEGHLLNHNPSTAQ
jgi:hypothetical protein